MICLIPENDALWTQPCHYRQWAIESADAYGNEVVVLHAQGEPNGIAEFRACYVHDSPNSKVFEQWCFEQWFHIAAWMESNNVPVVFKADSDVMLFFNLDQWYKSISRPIGSKPACNCFITKETARLSADFILDTFKRGLQKDRRLEWPFSSDQTILHYLWDSLGYHDLCSASTSGPCADQNVFLVQDGWPKHDGHKDIVFIQGIPYQATPNGARRLYNLHCWGKAKSAMANIWRQSRASLTAGPVRMEIL